MSKLSILAIGAMLLSPFAASAQAPRAPETRVRITQQSGLVTVGTLRALSPDSVIYLDRQGKPQGLALQNVELERSIGRTGRFWKTFGITVAAGAAAGGLISAATWEHCESDAFFGCFMVPASRAEAGILGVLAGGVIGIPIGALLGAVIKVEGWEPLHPPGR
jgi:hypothetical protein